MSKSDDILKQAPLPMKQRAPRGIAPVYSRSETREHEGFVESLMVQRPDLSVRQQGKVVQERFGISHGRYQKLRARIISRWASEDEQHRGAWKAQAMRRLERWIQKCEAMGDYRMLQRFHADLMDVQGVREPLKIDITAEVQVNLANVIMDLSQAQIDDAMNEYLETKQLAERARQLGMGEVIDVAAE